MSIEFQSYSRRRKKNKKTRLFLFFILFFIIVFILILKLTPANIKNSDTILSPLSNIANSPKENIQIPIQEISKTELFTNNTIYGIYIKNLKTKETYTYNENQKFSTASLYKLWAMVASFEKIEKKELKENEILEEDIAILNKKFQIASEEAELTEGVAKKTVKEAIEKMIIISDNYSAYLLISKIGLSSLNDFLDKYNLNASNTGSPPQTTAKDLALFFEKLYNKEFINEYYSDQMLELLTKQTFNDRIPKYLPEEIVVAHKTGELGSLKHDAGIVFGKDQDYIIIVLSDGEKPLEAAEKIANFSKAVYDFFNK